LAPNENDDTRDYFLSELVMTSFHDSKVAIHRNGRQTQYGNKEQKHVDCAGKNTQIPAQNLESNQARSVDENAIDGE